MKKRPAKTGRFFYVPCPGAGDEFFLTMNRNDITAIA